MPLTFTPITAAELTELTATAQRESQVNQLYVDYLTDLWAKRDTNAATNPSGAAYARIDIPADYADTAKDKRQIQASARSMTPALYVDYGRIKSNVLPLTVVLYDESQHAPKTRTSAGSNNPQAERVALKRAIVKLDPTFVFKDWSATFDSTVTNEQIAAHLESLKAARAAQADSKTKTK
jgi:hypothetical protein